MYAVIGLLKKPPHVSTDEFRSWWFDRHVPHVLEMPGLRHYVIYPLDESLDPRIGGEWSTDVDYDGLAIMYFDSREALRDAVSSPAGAEDREHFNSMVKESLVFGGEVMVKLGTVVPVES
jgi:uncharacterized protein (TIGR02118 family)